MRFNMRFFITLLALSVSPLFADSASFYKKRVIQEARIEFGLDAPAPLFAAQIHQESAWNKDARSPYANGLTQFTPDTEKWIKTVYPQSLGNGNAFDAEWAIRAMTKYDSWLYKRVYALDECNRWAFVLSAYNGGLGWVNRDKKLAQNAGDSPLVWFGSVENYSSRAKWAFRENRDYPKKIIFKHQPLYSGWGRMICVN